MFERNDEFTRDVDDVYALFTKLHRGDTLSHATIGRAIGLTKDDTPPRLCKDRSRYDHVVWGARKRLQRERQIACWYVEAVGYKLLTPAEQIESGLWHTEKAMRSAGRARRNVEDTPDRLCSAHLRRIKALTALRVAESRRQLARSARILRLQMKPTNSVPRRPSRETIEMAE